MRFFGRAALVMVALLTVGFETGAAVASPGEVAWRSSLEAARRDAANEGRSLLLVMESPGCGWCRKLDRTTLRDREVVEAINTHTVPVRIDASDPAHERLVAALGVQGFPTLVLLGADGQVLDRRSGYLDARQFGSWLRSASRP